MESTELVFVCISSFLGVFILLTVLALLMRLIIMVFPEKEVGADAAMVAAVTSAVQSVYPGTNITKIEEIK